MSAWAILEPLLLSAILLLCTLQALRKLAPATCRRARVACALALLRRQRHPLLRQLGRRLAPQPATLGVPAGGACGPCRGCEKPS